MEDTKKHVVIIGGGFGGTYTGKYLAKFLKEGKNDNLDITVINRTNYFLFTPLLHEVATGGLTPLSVVEPIREIFRNCNVRFIQDEAKGISFEKKEVTTSTTAIPFDYLVISSGAETNYYGTVGAKENTFTLKDLRDAQVLRKQLIDVCEKGALTEDESERKKILSIVIVGAGATGVELSAEIIEFMHETMCSYYKNCGIKKDDIKISLVAASPTVLPPFPPELQEIARKELITKGIEVKTSMQVTEVQKGKIIFGDKTFIEAGTIVWVAGVKPQMIDMFGIEKEKSGRIKIDEYMRVMGTTNIFAIGDVSGTSPMLAQVAAQQAKTVAQNIIADIEHGSLTPFKFYEKGLLVSLGQWYAAGRLFGFILKGPLMWLIWRAIYLFNFHSWRKRVKIGFEWVVNFFYPRDITET